MQTEAPTTSTDVARAQTHPRELANTPAHSRPHGKQERLAQRALRERRVRYILGLMVEDRYSPGITDRELGDLWMPNAKPKSRLALVHQYAALARSRLDLHFDRDEVARRISLRMDAAQRDAMRKGHYTTAARCAEVEMKIARIGIADAPAVGPTTHNHVQVIQVGAEATHLVTTPAMRALVRGRPDRLIDQSNAARAEVDGE